MKCCKRLGWLLPLVGGLRLVLAVSCSKDTAPTKVTELDLATVADPETDVGLVLMDSEGSRVAAFGGKNQFGLMSSMTGGAFVNPTGSTFAYWLGGNGLPEYAVSDGWLFRFHNYTDTTVDIDGVDNSHNPKHWYDVPVDKDDLRDLRESAGDWTGNVVDMPVGQKLNYLSDGLSVAGCVTGVLTFETGVGAVMAGVTCGDAITRVGKYFGNEDILGIGSTAINILGTGSTVISGVQCAHADILSCASFSLDAVDTGVKAAKTVKDTLKKFF